MEKQIKLLEDEFKKLSDKMVAYPSKFGMSDLDMMSKIASTLNLMVEMSEKIDEDSEDTHDMVVDELMGAQEYINLYLEDGDEIYKNMARDELRHAEHFINLAEDKASMQTKIDWYNSLLEKTRGWT